MTSRRICSILASFATRNSKANLPMTKQKEVPEVSNGNTELLIAELPGLVIYTPSGENFSERKYS